MATQQRPNTPYDPNRLRDPTTETDLSANEIRSSADFDGGLQADPPVREGPSSNTSIALIAVGIAIVLSIVFYGLNSTSIHQAAVPGQATSQNPAPTTPQAKGQAGTTTGAAPAKPQTNSPASTQPGGVNTNNANPGNATGNK